MKSALTIEAEEKSIGSASLAPLFIICFISTALGGSVSTLMSAYLPAVLKDLKGALPADELNSISGFINSIFIFGWALGGFTWGIISDRVGRKNALLMAIASYGIFTLLTGLAPDWWEIVFCRFMSGFGVGGVMVVSFTLISEVWPQKSRAVYTGILSISFPIGIFSAGLLNYFVTSWRQGFFIGAIPVLLALLGYWAINESEVWLEHKASGARLSASNKLSSPSNRKALVIGSLIFGTMLVGLWAIFSWMPTWIQSLVSGDSHKQGGLSMMFLGMGGLLGGFISGWVVNIIGLRRSLIASFAVCAVVSFVLFKTNASFTNIIYAEIALLALFFGISQGVLSIYIPLLFKTGVKASATGFCFNAGRIFTAAAVLFVGVLVTTLGGYGNALFIFSLVFVLGLLIVLFAKNIQPES